MCICVVSYFRFGVFQTPLFSQPLTETFVLREDFKARASDGLPAIRLLRILVTNLRFCRQIVSSPRRTGFDACDKTESRRQNAVRVYPADISVDKRKAQNFRSPIFSIILTSMTKLKIGIAGRDGCRYTKQIPAKSGGWMKEEVSPTEFRCNGDKALRSGVGVEAFLCCRRFKEYRCRYHISISY